jgi:hypothetical protein
MSLFCIQLSPRRFRSKNTGNWEDAASLRPTDLPSLILGLEAAGTSPPSQELPAWWNIYEGLSDDEVDRLDQAIRPRANLTRVFE